MTFVDEETSFTFWPATNHKLYTSNVQAKRLDNAPRKEWIEGYLTVHDYTGSDSNRRVNDNFETPTWLVIDIDRPKDPSETVKRAATDEELALNKERANDVKAYLEGLEWELSNEVCSGNGYHLWFKLTDWSFEQVRELLHYLREKFSDDDAEIDTSVCDPARLIRLPGTFNNKPLPGQTTGRRCTVLYGSDTFPTPVTPSQIPQDINTGVDVKTIPTAPVRRAPSTAHPVEIDRTSPSNLSQVIHKTLFAWWAHTNRIDFATTFDKPGTDRWALWRYAGREIINAGGNCDAIHDFLRQTQEKYDRPTTEKYINWMVQREMFNAGRRKWEETVPGHYEMLLKWRHRQIIARFTIDEIRSDNVIPVEVYSYGQNPTNYRMVFNDGKQFASDSKLMQSCNHFHRWLIENRGVYIHIHRFKQFHPTIVQLMLDINVPLDEEGSDEENLVEDFLYELMRARPEEKKEVLLYTGLGRYLDEEKNVVLVSGASIKRVIGTNMSLAKLQLMLDEEGLLAGPAVHLRIAGRRIRAWQFHPDLWTAEDYQPLEEATVAEAIAQHIMIELQKHVLVSDQSILLKNDQYDIFAWHNTELNEAWVSTSAIERMTEHKVSFQELTQEFKRRGVHAGESRVIRLEDRPEQLRIYRFKVDLWSHQFSTGNEKYRENLADKYDDSFTDLNV